MFEDIWLYLELAIVGLWGMSMLCLAVLSSRIRPTKNEFRKKYGWLVVFQSGIPFCKDWKKQIDKQDFEVFLRYNHYSYLSKLISLVSIIFLCIASIFGR